MKFNRHSRKLPKKDDLVNRDIRFPVVMVIGPDGPIGEMSTVQGMQRAAEQNLDLVCISPTTKPPICKILDYGKYKFEKSKKSKEVRKNRTVIVLKEVRITPNIGQHDLETKAKNAQKFLEQKQKVKVSLKFRGRERAHTEVGEDTLKRFFEILKEVAVMEKRPYSNGRFFDMILAPIKENKKGEANNAKNENKISSNKES